MSKKKQKKPAQMQSKKAAFGEHALRASGYKYKLLHLSAEERDEYENGRKVIVNGKETRRIAGEFDYWFKVVDGVEVRILKAGPDYYYAGGRVISAKQLPAIEEDAKKQKQYAHLAEQVIDTEPIPQVLNSEVVAEDYDTKSIPAGKILLIGGPLKNRLIDWGLKTAYYMAQLSTPSGHIKSYRYTRDKKMEQAGASSQLYYFQMEL